MSISRVPHKDTEIKGHLSGRTKHGLQFDLEVANGPTTNTVAKAKQTERFAHLRERFPAKQDQERKVIHLRVATPNGIEKIRIDSGREYMAGEKKSASLKDLVTSIAEDLEQKLGLGQKRTRWGI